MRRLFLGIGLAAILSASCLTAELEDSDPTFAVSGYSSVPLNLSCTGTYTVWIGGPGEPQTVSDYLRPTASATPTMTPGLTICVRWKATPYYEKFVINGVGSSSAPISVRGIPGPDGELPIIDGDGDGTTQTVDRFHDGDPEKIGCTVGENSMVSEDGNSGVIYVQGTQTTRAEHIVVENLEVRGGLKTSCYRDMNNDLVKYYEDAASIRVKWANNVTVRNCRLTESQTGVGSHKETGNPSGSGTGELLVQGNDFFNLGSGADTVGESDTTHSYTIGARTIYEFNRFGPFFASGTVTPTGEGLKDRSKNTVIRYNYFDRSRASKKIDLVHVQPSCSDGEYQTNDSNNENEIYGNIFIEDMSEANKSIVHFGADNCPSGAGDPLVYGRKKLLFHNNTVVSERTDDTFVVKLSSEAQSVDFRNNILFSDDAGDTYLAHLETSPLPATTPVVATFDHNWVSTGMEDHYVNIDPDCTIGFCTTDASLFSGSDPGFIDGAEDAYRLSSASSVLGDGLVAGTGVDTLDSEYAPLAQGENRPVRTGNQSIDLGAFANRPSVSSFSGDGVFVESTSTNHRFWMEAENEHLNWKDDSTNSLKYWKSYAQGFQPGRRAGTTYSATNEVTPRLDYHVNFPTSGWYRVWVRAHASSSSADEVWISLNRSTSPTLTRLATHGSHVWASGWWNGPPFNGQVPALINVPSAGIHTLSIWNKEGGNFDVDKIFLSTSSNDDPATLSISLSAEKAFLETSDQLSLQMEHGFLASFDERSDTRLQFGPLESQAAGELKALPDNGTRNGLHLGPSVEFPVYFEDPGRYFLWVKGKAQSSTSNAISVGVTTNGLSPKTNASLVKVPTGSTAAWAGVGENGARAYIDIDSVGYQTLRVFGVEQGVVVDAVILKRDKNYNPDVNGAIAESGLKL